MNAPWSCSGSQPTVGFQEMKEQISWSSLWANNCNPCPPSLTRKPKACSETVKDANGEGPLETKTPLQTKSAVWQDMSRPLYSGCEQDTVACKRTWSKLALWTLHSVIAKKQNRQFTTSSRTVPSGSNRNTSNGRRMSQPPTSWGEWRKTCAAPPNSWQHVDWGSKHGWSTAEEEEAEEKVWKTLTFVQVHSCMRNHVHVVANLSIDLDENEHVDTTTSSTPPPPPPNTHTQNQYLSESPSPTIFKGENSEVILWNNNNNNNNNDFISKALFHVKHAQLRCTMPMNNTHTHTRTRARVSKTSDERTIAYKSLKHNTIC